MIVKGRLGELLEQRRQILEMHWDSTPVAVIAETLRVPTDFVIATLKWAMVNTKFDEAKLRAGRTTEER